MDDLQKQRWSERISNRLNALTVGREIPVFRYLWQSKENKLSFLCYLEDMLEASALNDLHKDEYWELRSLLKEQVMQWYLYWENEYLGARPA